MKDQYGNTIAEGDYVITVQPGGGILPPAPATRGRVVTMLNNLPSPKLEYLIIYERPRGGIAYIALEGKINTLDLS